MRFEYLDGSSWIHWRPGDRFPYWSTVTAWRLVNQVGTVVFVGDYNGCFNFLKAL